MEIDLLFFMDKYVSLMPVEEKRITMKLKDSDAKGERPNVEISGFKLKASSFNTGNVHNLDNNRLRISVY